MEYPASQLPPSLSLTPEKQAAVSVVEITEDDDPLAQERKRLRRHLGLGDEPGDPPIKPPQIQPLFFIERVPGAKDVACKLPGCTQRIEPGDLRLALNPGMGENMWFRSSSDFYHISCFESLADFTQALFLDRIQPLTRNTFELRGLKPSSVADSSYLVSGGVERLILEWKVTRGIAIDKRDGVYDEKLYWLDSSIHQLLYKAGSASYRPSGRPAMVDHYEYYTLSRTLAPVESDGIGDKREWNLFQEGYVDEGNTHGLSAMLRKWEGDVMLAWQDSREQDSGGAQEKNALNPKALRAIRRLSAIPTPQVGYNRLFS